MFGARLMRATLRDADRAMALNYVPEVHRDQVGALWTLDEALGRVVQTTSEPMIGQMRLTWWHERLCEIDEGVVAAEPILAGCAALCATTSLTGAMLAGLVEGWEALLEPLPLSRDGLGAHMGRGRTLFELTAVVLGGVVDPRAGEGWAAMDFAAHCSDPVMAGNARRLAAERLAECRLPAIKALRILTRLARGDSKRLPGAVRPRTAVLVAVLF